MKRIKFKRGYKYQLADYYEHRLRFKPVSFGSHDYFWISPIRTDLYALLTVKKGYAWNGASGPAVDTRSTMRASLVHDTLYQAIREGIISENHRRNADNEFYVVLREDGVGVVRAWLYWAAVRIFGGLWNRYGKRKVEVAP